jgi:outer membrane protein assembly factor BamE
LSGRTQLNGRSRNRGPRLAGAAALIATLVVAACAYKLDVQQGNYLDADTVAQVQEGMTRKQVRFLLGTPMIEDPFHADRWDYVYFFKPGKRGKSQERHLAVYFSADSVTRVERLTGY